MKLNELTEKISADTEAGRFGRSGSRFPAARELAELYGTAFVTALKCVRQLKDRHLLMSVGAKNYVCMGQAAPATELWRLIRAQPSRIGIHLRDLTNPYFAAIAEKLNEGLLRRGCLPVILSSSNDPALERAGLERILEEKYAGLISFVGHETDEITALYSRFPLPKVLIGRKVVGTDASFVASDNFHSGASAAGHLTECGYTRFAYVRAPYAAESGHDERLDGFRHGLKLAGAALPDNNVLTLDGGDEVSRRRVAASLRALLKEGRVGVFCYHDLIASTVYRVLKALDVPIPDRAGLIGYDDLSSVSHLELTTFRYNFAVMADTAIALIEERMAGNRPCRGVNVQTILVARRTTAKG